MPTEQNYDGQVTVITVFKFKPRGPRVIAMQCRRWLKNEAKTKQVNKPSKSADHARNSQFVIDSSCMGLKTRAS